jgi:hypothetical protein
MHSMLPEIRNRIMYFLNSNRKTFLWTCLATVSLGLGLLWSRLVLSHFQHIEGYEAIGNSQQGEYYKFWSVSLPSWVCLVIWVGCMILAIRIPLIRRQYALLSILAVYLLFLTFAHIFLFAGFGFEAFD